MSNSLPLIGRTDSLCEIREAMLAHAGTAGQTPNAFFLIHGQPGAGTSTLARAVSEHPDIRAAFTGGVFSFGLGAEPNFHAYLSKVYLALGVREHTPSTDDGEGADESPATPGPVLVVLDDLREAEHLSPFLACGDEITILATMDSEYTARGCAGRGGVAYNLGALEEDSSLEFLSLLAPSVVAAHPSECADLARGLDGLPLLLHLAGLLLGETSASGYGPAELLRDLRRSRAPAKGVADSDLLETGVPLPASAAALLQVVTGRLDPETRQRFTSLAAFAAEPATFDEASLRALWLTEETADTVNELVRRGLLTRVGSDRFAIHKLLSSYAAKSFTSVEHDELGTLRMRAARHYFGKMRVAEELFARGGADSFNSLELIDADWGQMSRAYSGVGRAAPYGEEASALCREYALTAEQAMGLRFSLKRQSAWLEAALATGVPADRPDDEARVMNHLCRAYLHRGYLRVATAYLLKADAHAGVSPDPGVMAGLLSNLADCVYLYGDVERAFMLWTRALVSYREMGDARGQAEVLLSLAVKMMQMEDAGAGLLKESVPELFDLLSELEEELDETFGGVVDHVSENALSLITAIMMAGQLSVGAGLERQRAEYARAFTLGFNAWVVNDYENELVELFKALEAQRLFGVVTERGDFDQNSYFAMMLKGQQEQLRARLERFQQLAGDEGTEEEPRAYVVNKIKAQTRQTLSRIIETLGGVLQMFQRLGDASGQGETLRKIAEVRLGAGEAAPAREYFEKALSLQETAGSEAGVAEILKRLGEVRAGGGDEKAAIALWEHARRICRDAEDFMGENRIDLLIEGAKVRTGQAQDLNGLIGGLIKPGGRERLGKSQTLDETAAYFYGQRDLGRAVELWRLCLACDDRLRDEDQKDNYLTDMVKGVAEWGDAEYALELLGHVRHAQGVYGRSADLRRAEVLKEAGDVAKSQGCVKHSAHFYRKAAELAGSVEEAG